MRPLAVTPKQVLSRRKHFGLHADLRDHAATGVKTPALTDKVIPAVTVDYIPPTHGCL
jgi:hypothetical protein